MTAYAFDTDFPPGPIRIHRLPLLQSSRLFVDVFNMIGGAEQTMVFYATLTRKHSVIDMHLAHIGPLTSLPLQPREMYRQAFYDGAAEIALMHNHLAGDPNPSLQDEKVTEQLRIAGEILGIPLFDHIIVAGRTSFSFYDTGLL